MGTEWVQSEHDTREKLLNHEVKRALYALFIERVSGTIDVQGEDAGMELD